MHSVLVAGGLVVLYCATCYGFISAPSWLTHRASTRLSSHPISRSSRLQLQSSSNTAKGYDNQQLIQSTAELAAIEAGKAILAGSGSIDLQSGVESKIGSRDIVTKVDKEAQEIIEQTILKAFPHHSFLGEEDVAPGMEAAAAAIDKYKQKVGTRLYPLYAARTAESRVQSAECKSASSTRPHRPMSIQ
jgi:DNA-binding cell septation regulator SpoVG